MAEHTAISWADATFNPWVGCQRNGPGCDNCYAEALMDHRLHRVQWGPGQPRDRTSAANWRQPRLWDREHEAFMLMHGRRRRVFCASLADVFDNEVPVQWRADLFQLIADTPHLDWLLLTKRIGNAESMINAAISFLRMGGWKQLPWPWPHVAIGATMVNQPEFDRDYGKLLGVRAATRFVSFEPLLGQISIDQRLIAPIEGTSQHGQRFIDWVIVGGESGPNARPMHPSWARNLRDQCAAAGVPFHFKQWGEWLPVEPNGSALRGCGATPEREPAFRFEHGHHFTKVGKAAAGRVLDGIEHNAFPHSGSNL